MSNKNFVRRKGISNVYTCQFAKDCSKSDDVDTRGGDVSRLSCLHEAGWCISTGRNKTCPIKPRKEDVSEPTPKTVKRMQFRETLKWKCKGLGRTETLVEVEETSEETPQEEVAVIGALYPER